MLSLYNWEMWINHVPYINDTLQLITGYFFLLIFCLSFMFKEVRVYFEVHVYFV